MPSFTVTVALTLTNVTLTQLDTFLAAGVAAVPGAELNSVDLTVKLTQAAATPGAAAA